MKISTKPMSSKTVERSECQLVRSPNPEEAELVVPYRNPGKTKTQEESKLPLSIGIKTETKDSEIVKLCRSKRITCQDTIHEYDEDDGLTMEKVGRWIKIFFILQILLLLLNIKIKSIIVSLFDFLLLYMAWIIVWNIIFEYNHVR